MTHDTFNSSKLIDSLERNTNSKEQKIRVLQQEIPQVNIQFSVHKFISTGKEISALAAEQATLKEVRFILLYRGGDSDATIRDLGSLLNLESVSEWLIKDYVNDFIQDVKDMTQQT